MTTEKNFYLKLKGYLREKEYFRKQQENLLKRLAQKLIVAKKAKRVKAGV